MIDYIYHLIPERLRLGLDLGAAGITVPAFMGYYTSVMGAIGATAGTAYAIARFYYYIKDRRAAK